MIAGAAIASFGVVASESDAGAGGATCDAEARADVLVRDVLVLVLVLVLRGLLVLLLRWLLLRWLLLLLLLAFVMVATLLLRFNSWNVSLLLPQECAPERWQSFPFGTRGEAFEECRCEKCIICLFAYSECVATLTRGTF